MAPRSSACTAFVLGRRDGSAVAGHLVKGIVRPTLEATKSPESPAHLARRFDHATGLTIDPAGLGVRCTKSLQGHMALAPDQVADRFRSLVARQAKSSPSWLAEPVKRADIGVVGGNAREMRIVEILREPAVTAAGIAAPGRAQILIVVPERGDDRGFARALLGVRRR